MKRLVPLILFAPLLVLAGCERPASDPAQTTGTTASPTAPAATAPSAAAPANSAPSASPSPDLSAPKLTAAAEKGVKGARNVLLEWARALERRDFARADAQWGLGADEAGSAAGFAKFRTMTVAIGDGAVEGGAGSLYYEVPVTITGTTADGASQKLAGSVTARRVNDVDGATPEQLRWHLAGLNLAG